MSILVCEMSSSMVTKPEIQPEQTKRIPVRDALRDENVGRRVQIAGWVRTKRESKAGVSFVEVNDGSCLRNVQVVVPENLPHYERIMSDTSTGASVVVTGEIVASP